MDGLVAAQLLRSSLSQQRLSAFYPPRDLPGVIGWYDASTLSGSDGTSIGRLPDQSGFGHDLTQFTSANRPTKQTGADGKPVLRFAAAQFLACGAVGGSWPVAAAPQPLTFVAACKMSSAQSGSGTLVGGVGTAGTARVQFTNSTRTPYAYAGSTGTPATGPNLADDTWHVVAAVLDTAAAAVYVDGYLTNAAPTQIHGTDSLKTLILGAESASVNQWLGDVAEVIVCQGRLTPKQVERVTALLAAKRGLPATGLCSAPSTFEDTTDANGVNVRIFTPPVPSTPRTLVLWSHPASQNEQLAPGYWAYGLAHAAVSQGWYFAATRQHSDSWGNTSALTDLTALDTLMAGRATFTKKILVGASMGGLPTALTIASGAVANVVGGYFIDAALSLSAMFAGNAGTYSSSIRTAYGIAADGSDYSTKTTGHDPALLSAASYPAGIGYRFLASSSDTTVDKAANTDAFRTLLASRSPAESGLVSHLSTHLNGGALDPADFATFVKRCLAR